MGRRTRAGGRPVRRDGHDARPGRRRAANGWGGRQCRRRFAHRALPLAAIGGAVVVVSRPAVDVVAAAVFGADDDGITGGKLLLAQGARLAQEGGRVAEVVGTDHDV